MSTPGCTVSWAANYNPDADVDDGSCIYLQKVGGVCYRFGDLEPGSTKDLSFTLSYALGRGWSFYHDYWPDYYIHTRNQLMNIKAGKAYYANLGLRGQYHDSTIHPFFIDALFSGMGTLKQSYQARYSAVMVPYPAMILDSVNWQSETRSGGNDPETNDQPALYNETITAITIWNQYQCTGRILLDQGKISLQFSNNRDSEQRWSFNDIRNKVAAQGVNFLLDIFNDYAVDNTNINQNLSWFNKQLVEGDYFIVRFEFDNNNNKQITLHELDVDVTRSYR